MAAIETLTDKTIQAALKAAKAEGKAKTISDGGGLTLQAQPSGIGWWRLRYWIDSRENRLSLGTYPVISLALAREKRRDAVKLKAEGIDPSNERKAAKRVRTERAAKERALASGEALPGSFQAVALEWLAHVHEAKVSESHAARTRIRFEQDVFPWLGARPMGEIDAPELLTVLRRVVGRGAIETAHRVKDACGQVFRYGVASGHCERNPAADLRDALPPVQTKHLAAIVDPKQVGALLRDMASYDGHPVTRAALALSSMLLLRPGELRHMEWVWIDFDAAVLSVPAEVMKRSKADKANGPPHVVPLAPQAVAVLEEIKPLSGSGRFVFPALTSRQRCMSENTVRSALRRMGYGNDDMTAHGFRATARTMAAERLGIAPEVIEAQLGHAVPDALGRAYNRTQYLAQRRELMVAWADYLDVLRKGASVIPLAGRVA
ncbi:integrase arm-type DNA-binding domain-containing protein [Pelomonas sp. SE-A7]|uniref:tyrosine-type recombinase/integrase n=1 Tax=Pelomonas sp. SE-A7 TaxID=3054953 RepID=UPI00259C99C3|nr:integrase arm-type DNA-binding domain-containing protein [Pelomonas sp. SE-A7]MDM4765535.1 integrase arm-type DNA-binding domain-containing protein [Pelomonas sp. SE-A7]